MTLWDRTVRGRLARLFLPSRISVRIGLRLLNLTPAHISFQTFQTSPYVLAATQALPVVEVQIHNHNPGNLRFSPTLLRSPVHTCTVSKSTMFLFSSSPEKVCPSLKSIQTRYKLNSTVYPVQISSRTTTSGNTSTSHAFTGPQTSRLISDFVPFLRLGMTMSVP